MLLRVTGLLPAAEFSRHEGGIPVGTSSLL